MKMGKERGRKRRREERKVRRCVRGRKDTIETEK
jgi:hypothetical protein